MLFIYPSTVEFDEQTTHRVLNRLVDEIDGKVDVEWGLTYGITLIDGIVSTGGGFVHYDRRDFKDYPNLDARFFQDSFFYFNIQAIEAIKGAIKRR